jgi:hypothetical protein
MKIKNNEKAKMKIRKKEAKKINQKLIILKKIYKLEDDLIKHFFFLIYTLTEVY